MYRVYISYRRLDSGDLARRIYQILEKELGESVVFKDDKIPPGAEWHSFLRETLDTADVLIVVIGPDWLSVPGSNQPCLFEPGDFHRSEIETALNGGKLVVPVTVNNAVMPAPDDLPDSIRDLYQRMSFRVRNEPNFKADLAKLADYLRQTLEIDPVKEGEAPTKNDKADGKEEGKDKPSLQIILAIIALVGTLGAALFGVLPDLIDRLQVPTPTPTYTPTATDQPGTPIVLTQLDMTATEAMLQLTVDARASENALLPAQNTQIAAQTQTGPAPTTGAPASETPASSATPTSVPMTSTLSILHIRETQVAESISLTQTSIALTGIAIQNAALLATLTPTQNGSSVNPVTLTIYRDEDSFTLYVPQSSAPISLVGLEFRVTLLDGSTIVRRLDQDFAAFLGLPFDNLNSLGQAVCFRLMRSGGTHTVPQDCQPPAALLLAQSIALADAFWHNRDTGTGHTVLIYRGDQLMGACGPQVSCVVSWPSASAAVVPTESVGYPCDGEITSRGSSASVLNIVERNPSDGANTTPIRVGTTVLVTEESSPSGWYYISDSNGINLGWVRERYIQLSNTCP